MPGPLLPLSAQVVVTDPGQRERVGRLLTREVHFFVNGIPQNIVNPELKWSDDPGRWGVTYPLLLNQKGPARGLFRMLLFLPAVVPIIVVPIHLGGIGNVFSAVPAAKLTLAVPPAGSLGSYSAYATLALGSALALFLYPHSITGIL